MSLAERLDEDLREALRSGDERRKVALRMAKAAIHNAEVANQATLDDAGIVAVLSKQARQYQESIEEFRKGNRADLVAKEETELAVLKAYLPEPISQAEIEKAAREVIAEVGAIGPGDKGKVMQALMPKLSGKADGRQINAVVTELLSGNTPR
jgi:uncharacterized protein YqeY